MAGWQKGCEAAASAAVRSGRTCPSADVGRMLPPRAVRPSVATGVLAAAVGVTAALLYVSVFAVRPLLALWRPDAGVPPTLPPVVDLLLMLRYVLGGDAG